MAQICARVSVSYRGHKNSGSGSVVKLLMRDEVLVVNIAKLPELLRSANGSGERKLNKPSSSPEFEHGQHQHRASMPRRVTAQVTPTAM